MTSKTDTKTAEGLFTLSDSILNIKEKHLPSVPKEKEEPHQSDGMQSQANLLIDELFSVSNDDIAVIYSASQCLC